MNNLPATLWKSAATLRESLRRLAKQGRIGPFLETLDPRELSALFFESWPVFAGPAQRPPLGDWRTWLLLGGRGAGKTRAGAEWVKALATGAGHAIGDAAGRVALVGESYADARAVMVEGESGLLAIHARSDRPVWHSSRRRLTWPNGAIAQVFSASDPEGLRGSQFGAAWCDELAKWDYLQETWDMLQFCLRLGSGPRQLATTTPKPLPLLKRLLADPATAVTRCRTLDNHVNLAPGFVEGLTSLYGGTRLGRQELDGEIIDDAENALWRRSQIDASRQTRMIPLRRIVVAVDPPASANQGSSACGIIAAGKDDSGKCYVLNDRTMKRATPRQWADAVVCLYHSVSADAIVAEVNQGGDMVKSCIRNTDCSLPVIEVRAKRSKWLRAEPVALLYERGRVIHVGQFPELEDEMCGFGYDGLAGGRSPDRLDALVWAITSLALTGAAEPRVRLI
jgi:phage terminase large subunit-like protein